MQAVSPIRDLRAVQRQIDFDEGTNPDTEVVSYERYRRMLSNAAVQYDRALQHAFARANRRRIAQTYQSETQNDDSDSDLGDHLAIHNQHHSPARKRGTQHRVIICQLVNGGCSIA